ncbi:MAG: CoB--CoM heterodisulfide reductase subunit B [Methanomassiliicoccaceae archaeon]|jgi:heterodisulfide reductase subunit B|nr:CoB--CoM heterodisulfide reductase subunit B [Euryarchaeota archaeon]HOB38412.1 CoB--CoM heterodisulfide reductase subunit B [Methanomassiliicoccaceae archaeon]HOL07693.1 CoB--CoM heterodisulfide reductase subunit B [Methanomassiliicoccaceae archaeon]HPP44445.1 CoB--CoM heterodisulfide reductase subunit B [Methanomassiliicoccaceae archaeon]HQA21543.1 CoB--CoM heterodisulfide reductase subunit B [Methanomassiliicoccaceae archaeon]
MNLNKKYALFLGCVAPARYPGIEAATREVCKTVGLDLVELEGAGCCPAPGVIKSFDQDTWLAIAARNLALAEKQGADILTICNGCYGSLYDAAHILNGDAERLSAVNKILSEVGMEYKGTTQVRHFAELLYKEITPENVKAKTKTPLDIKVAVHYGCHFLKPSKIKELDDPERPRILDEIVEATGATNLDYRDKQMCCGAGGGVRSGNPELATKFTVEKLKSMKSAGAQYIIDVCPFCHLQFDRTQKDVQGYDLPVIHLAQLLGLAFGVPASKLGMDYQEVPAKF